MKLLLTSAGFYNYEIIDAFKKIISNAAGKKVAIITTAAKGKQKNKCSIYAKKQLLDIGVESVDFIDLEFHPEKYLKSVV